MQPFTVAKLLHANPLSCPADVADWHMEGDAHITFPNGRMRIKNARNADEGQAANLVYWCAETFPDNIAISWDFWPVREPGLCILFFAACGQQGEDLFDPSLAPRTGIYNQYHHGDINALHVSYFRRKNPSERAFHTCNLRKSYGFHLVAQGADPIPDVVDTMPPYHIQLIKAGPAVAFTINDLPILHWKDDGEAFCPVLGGGKIGFRQMAPLIGEYANLTVHAVREH
ncbi:MAG: YesU family protein [bacterium]